MGPAANPLEIVPWVHRRAKDNSRRDRGPSVGSMFREVVAASGPGSCLRSPGSGRAIVPLDVFVSLSEEMID